MGRVLPCLMNIADKHHRFFFFEENSGRGTMRAILLSNQVELRPNSLKAYDHENSID